MLIYASIFLFSNPTTSDASDHTFNAEASLQSAIDAASAAADNTKLTAALIELADYYRDAGRLDEAEPINRRALSIVNDTFGSGVPAALNALISLGATLRDEGKLAESEYTLRNALVVASRQPSAYNRGGQFKDINIFCNNVIANPKMLQGTAENAEAFDALAELFLKENRLQDAQRLYERELEIFGLLDANDSADNHTFWPGGSIRHTLQQLAEVYDLQGKKEEAQTRLHQALNYK